MALNSKPLRQVTQEDIDTYKRDGAVCLRKVFDPEWCEMLDPIARRVSTRCTSWRSSRLPSNPRGAVNASA